MKYFTQKNIALLVVTGIVIVALILLFRGSGNPKKQAPADMSSIPFGAFIADGGSYVCSVAQEADGIVSDGVVFMHQGKIRGEYTTTLDNVSMTNYVIITDGMAYTWSSMVPGQGLQAPAEMPELVSGEQELEFIGDIMAGDTKIGNYVCSAIEFDPKRFEIPTDITFFDAPQAQ